MNRKVVVVLMLTATAWIGGAALADEAKDAAAVAKQLPSAKITLQQGLTASESIGQPISGKCEIDEGIFSFPCTPPRALRFKRL